MSDNFETKIKRLEQIVNELNNNEVGLDEAIKLYQEGIELSSFCYNKLNEVENQSINIFNESEIEKLKGANNNE